MTLQILFQSTCSLSRPPNVVYVKYAACILYFISDFHWVQTHNLDIIDDKVKKSDLNRSSLPKITRLSQD